MLALLGQQLGGGVRTWGLEQILVAIVIIAAAIGLVYIALRVFGVTIPA